ncbi:helix-turn-helix transcriptional regulator [Hymenobacter sp. GOD-10R]|uniref:helix-turn-helix transcriptional regulator n=1 Tax=Hymenobacter sp. GOD-10R TaxID=3093922 RepID=UPI002D775417|nr:helix-turn-helix transcriptional regulator [Hymenobacter sp. GOD-10R]WRQ31482.1 helix-turn-helix transcriptional regulator [Hymenobacter sp. GOD-10R]
MSLPPSLTPDDAGCVLYIKHMVCSRGIRIVRRELESLGLRVLDVRLGAATVVSLDGQLDWARIRLALAAAGFALLESPTQALVDRVKLAVAGLLRRAVTLRHRELIPTLAREMGLDSRRLHAAFAQLPGHESLISYITSQRLAYAQELLATSRLDIGRIARQLGYGSLAHFSGQFRRFAQCSPSAYRQQVALVQSID